MEPITNKPITPTLVYRIEQLAWRAAGGEGEGYVDALPDGVWMKSTAESVGVPACVVEAIVGDMRRFTKWHRDTRRSTEIGARYSTVIAAITRPGSAKILNDGEVSLPDPIRCLCGGRIQVAPCRTCRRMPPGVEPEKKVTRRTVSKAARIERDDKIQTMLEVRIPYRTIAEQLSVSLRMIGRVASKMREDGNRGVS